MLKSLPHFTFFLLLFTFSFWLMFHTFSYNQATSSFLVAGKVWSDFGNALPLIRSFTYGHNWPPQYPLYPGEPIRYHFFFYLLTGFLESLGLRLDLALNLLSGFGFFFMLVFIYLIATKLFSSKAVGYLSILLFLFNGSLSFLKYFEKNGLTWAALTKIITNSAYPTFGPWDGNPIAAIWNLNIYTNQRHLALSIALALVCIYICLLQKFAQPLSKKLLSSVALALTFGTLMLTNQAIFAGLGAVLFWVFIFRPPARSVLFVGAILSLPWFFFSQTLVNLTPSIEYKLGFFTPEPVTASGLLKYWFYNVGFLLILLPLGFFLSPRKAKFLLLPILTLFIIPNVFRLSTDLFNNHKLFNFFIIFANMFVAYSLVYVFRYRFLRVWVVIVLFFLTFSGVIDFFALKNDDALTLKDISSDPDVAYFLNHTPADAIVANSYWFYHPASLAGRRIFSGYTYFTWSHGYDQGFRENQLIAIYRSTTKAAVCAQAKQHNISYLELRDNPEEYLHPNFEVFNQEFTPEYTGPNNNFRVYNIATSCQ